MENGVAIQESSHRSQDLRISSIDYLLQHSKLQLATNIIDFLMPDTAMISTLITSNGFTIDMAGENANQVCTCCYT